MGYKTMRALATIFILSLLSACGGGGADNTLQVPEPSLIVGVQASDNNRNSSALSEPAEIAKAVEELKRMGANWKSTKDAIPNYDYSVAFVGATKRPVLVYWIGADWLGANDMQGKANFRQSLSPEDRKRLIESVGF